MSTLPQFVVAIGASAGGLKALESFFRAMPEGVQLPFIVVQHLSPDYKSFMPEIMRGFCNLEVRAIEDGDAIEPGRIHLLSPGHGLRVEGGKLRLTERKEVRGVHLPIDEFFSSLAADAGERAIAVVLSGTGSDGSRGIRAIKQSGGLVMVQDAESASFDGMLRSAMGTGMTDLVLPAQQMPRAIVDFTSSLPAQLSETSDEDALASVLRRVLASTGVDFTEYRSTTLMRRLANRMTMLQIPEVDSYSRYLIRNPEEIEALFRDLVIGVTQFFRDPESWELVAKHVIPEVCRNGEGAIRLWCPGCSTGEEPYTLAALFRQFLDDADIDRPLKIFATDIDSSALRYAAAGAYPLGSAVDIPAPLLERYFRTDSSSLRVTPAIRNSVVFSQHNVLSDPPFSRLDMVSCRNLLIYVNADAQKRALTSFTYGLDPGGFLLQGSSESLGDFSDVYNTINARWRLHRVRPGARRIALPSASRRLSTRSTTAPASVTNNPTEANRLYTTVLARFGPAAVVVDSRHDIQAVLGDVDPYLRIPIGRPSSDLLSMARYDLGPILGTLLHRVRQSSEAVDYPNVVIRDAEGERTIVSLHAEPVSDGKSSGNILIVFRDATPREAQTVDVGQVAHLADLQAELQYTKESLQASIEELETANEELQVTNEELLASNEELQATNEELQSVNEELVTVNAEYGNKIEELSQLQSDVDNLFRITCISTLFLNRDLEIRRFSQSAAKVFELVPTDTGRRITTFANHLEYLNFEEDLKLVLRELRPVQRKVSDNQGRKYIVDIFPYENAEHTIDGIVCTFQDTTDRERISQELQAVVSEIDSTVAHRMAAAASRRLRVLMVEDSATDIKNFMRSFRGYDADMVDAQTMKDALRLANEDWDLVLIDVNLPDGNGLDLLPQLRAEGMADSIPVVFLTGSITSELADEAYARGASFCMQKPTRPDHLSSLVGFLRQSVAKVTASP